MMVQRLGKVEEVIRYIAPARIFRRTELQLDYTFELPATLMEVMNSDIFWDSRVKSANGFDFICECMGVCDSDYSSHSTSFACISFVRAHLQNVG